jgi:hypothetical protein
MRTISGLLALALLVGCAESATGPRDGAAVLEQQDVLVLSSAWSGYMDGKQIVVADADAWAAEWQAIWSNHVPVPPVPAVDFTSSVIVIAALGQRPTTGYSVVIEQVRLANGSLAVDVRERSPGTSCATGQAVTSPVHIVQVPRQATTAAFTIRRVTYSC